MIKDFFGKLHSYIGIRFIARSNIRKSIPFMNPGLALVCSSVIFAASMKPLYNFFDFIPTSLMVGSVLAMFPFLLMDIMARYNAENARRNLAEFVSVLNRWCAVKDDIFYAFERASDSGIKEPLKTFVKDFGIQVNRGVEPLKALEIMRDNVDNPQFKDFVSNIRQNIRHRGDTRKLLSILEEQFYRIDEEYVRRRISTFKDRLTVIIIMLIVLTAGATFIKVNPDVCAFYMGTLQGKTLMMIFCLLYIAGFAGVLKIMRFDY